MKIFIWLLTIGFILASKPAEALPKFLEDNEGSTLTTKPGEPLKESMFYGKWDLDGERTNTANGDAGVGAIPSDIVKDVLGKGWKFEKNGVLKTDKAIGSTKGTWKLSGSTLIIHEGKTPEPVSFKAHFKDGYMYLKKPGGEWMVMEKSKFFGF